MADHGPFNAVLALHSNAPANELARLLVLTAPRERWARQQLVDLVEALRPLRSSYFGALPGFLECLWLAAGLNLPGGPSVLVIAERTV